MPFIDHGGHIVGAWGLQKMNSSIVDGLKSGFGRGFLRWTDLEGSRAVNARRKKISRLGGRHSPSPFRSELLFGIRADQSEGDTKYGRTVSYLKENCFEFFWLSIGSGLSAQSHIFACRYKDTRCFVLDISCSYFSVSGDIAGYGYGESRASAAAPGGGERERRGKYQLSSTLMEFGQISFSK